MLHSYADEVLGKKANLRVLRALVRHRGKVFTVRELARTAGLSHPQVSTVLRELEPRGIVKLQPVGRAYQVTLNDQSYILRSVIEPLFAAEERTIESLIADIRPLFEKEGIVSAAIFGSVARAEEGETSDIDLLVVAKDKELANERVSAATGIILSRFGRALSPLILDEERFMRNRGTDLERSILADHILVCGRDLGELVRSAKASR